MKILGIAGRQFHAESYRHEPGAALTTIKKWHSGRELYVTDAGTR
jgi:hypothetical protein